MFGSNNNFFMCANFNWLILLILEKLYIADMRE